MNKLGHRPSELAHDEPPMCDIVKSTPPPKKKEEEEKNQWVWIHSYNCKFILHFAYKNRIA